MVISVGDLMPPGRLYTMVDSQVVPIDANVLFAGKRVVLFAVPAVFTPGCTRNHLPGYIDNADAIKDKGFDVIACLSVSDAWVMNAWREAAGAGDKILMLADGNADYVRALGLELDLASRGMGIRSKRFALVIQDGVVETLSVDERAINTTSAASACQLECAGNQVS